MTETERTCAYEPCANTFAVTRPHRKYCRRSCMLKANRARKSVRFMTKRICAYKPCSKEFTLKVKGQKQIYCRTMCREQQWQKDNPRPAVLEAQYQRTYYQKHRTERIAAVSERKRLTCECGNRKPSAKAKMCDDCAAMPSVNEALK